MRHQPASVQGNGPPTAYRVQVRGLVEAAAAACERIAVFILVHLLAVRIGAQSHVGLLAAMIVLPQQRRGPRA